MTSTTTPDWQNCEIPRDGYGRPLIVPAKGGDRIPYRRTTTFIKALDDQTGLTKYLNRRVAFGMAHRKDLITAALAADPTNDKKFGEIAENALSHAKGILGDPAEIGTALHSFTERIDRGLPLGEVPQEYQADLDAYRAATAGIEWLGIETFRVHDKIQIAGTADRIAKIRGRTMIADLKTGKISFPHSMAMQLACYARMTPYDIATDQRMIDPEVIDLNRGVIIHLPAGQGKCDLYTIDIAKGWGAVLIAQKVWSWRSTKGLTELIDPLETEPTPATWESLTLSATTIERLRELWKRASELGQMTDDLNTLITQRVAALEATS